jgi:phage baseplate assembly protein W
MVTRADTITELATKVETYSDFSNSFAKHPITYELVTLKNEDSVKQALKNLILTNIGERPFNPFFGSNVRRTLFENFSVFTREDIVRYVQMAARQFERRINLKDITVIDDVDKQGVKVNVTFSLINRPEPINLNIFLKRVR